MQQQNPAVNDEKKCEQNYAQLAVSVTNNFDGTIIFYQIRPVQIEKNNFVKYKSTVEEIARVTLPHRVLKELSVMLSKQIKDVEAGKNRVKRK